MRGPADMMERRVKLKHVNPHITCYLCQGYLVDATTITECLHTFCKTCIVRYLDENNMCPQCEIVIHQSHPKNYISHDRTMQDIVLKLVPGLQEREMKRHHDFYRKRNLPIPKCLMANEDQEEEQENKAKEDPTGDNHRSDEQVNIMLECHDNQLRALKRRFIRCSSNATITHLKKFIALKLYSDINRFKEIEVLLNEEILGKDHTLKFVCITRWRHKDIPLKLNYRPKIIL